MFYDSSDNVEFRFEVYNGILNGVKLHLKGKFSSGIEGALASTLNRDFNWKQLYMYQK